LFSEDPGFTDDINNSRHRLPLLWFVDNIEEVMAELLNRKVEMANGLRKHPYGLREFAFTDINGYYVRVAESIDQG
jgi:hypothetical protein